MGFVFSQYLAIVDYKSIVHNTYDLYISLYTFNNFNFVYVEAVSLLHLVNNKWEFYSLELLYLSEEFNHYALKHQ